MYWEKREKGEKYRQSDSRENARKKVTKD